LLTWFIFDITSNKVRRMLVKQAFKLGFYRVQKSVFLGKIEKTDADTMKLYSEEIIDKDTDSVYIFPVCDEDFKKARFVGQAFNRELVCDELRSLVI